MRMTGKIIEPSFCFYKGSLQKDLGIAVLEGTIAAIGTSKDMEKEYPDYEVLQWKHLALVPGTVNAHNHSFQSLQRGIAADRPFLEWRDESLYKYSPKMRPVDIYTGALLAFADMF